MDVRKKIRKSSFVRTIAKHMGDDNICEEEILSQLPMSRAQIDLEGQDSR